MALKAAGMEKILRILILEDRSSDADLIEFELREAGIAFTSQRADFQFNFSSFQQVALYPQVEYVLCQ